jgi:hypothetical protein
MQIMKKIAKDIVVATQMDVVAEFYSKPQMGGALKAGSRRGDSYIRYSIPVHKGSRVGTVAGGVAEAVKMAGGGIVKAFARENPRPDQERKMHAGANKFRESFQPSATGLIAKALDDHEPRRKRSASPSNEGPTRKKSKKTNKKKHKRKSKINTYLGDESF